MVIIEVLNIIREMSVALKDIFICFKIRIFIIINLIADFYYFSLVFQLGLKSYIL